LPLATGERWHPESLFVSQEVFSEAGLKIDHLHHPAITGFSIVLILIKTKVGIVVIDLQIPNTPRMSKCLPIVGNRQEDCMVYPSELLAMWLVVAVTRTPKTRSGS